MPARAGRAPGHHHGGVGAAHAQAGRARSLGVITGVMPVGPLNAITDVPGVLVGQTTVVDRRFGAHRRHRDPAARRQNLFLERVPAAIYVGNGFGKLLGVTQVDGAG